MARKPRKNISETTTDDDRLAAAISALATSLAKPQPENDGSSNPSKLLKMLEGILPSIVMFILGYIFIQGVELDLKRDQFTASAADKLRSYVQELIVVDSATSAEKLEATALALGGFGAVAVIPLISVMEQSGAKRITAAKLGLEQAGRISPKRACEAMANVIDDTTDAYSWQTRKAIAEVSGLVGCASAVKPLQRMRAKLPGWGLDAELTKSVTIVVDEAMNRIDAANQRRTLWD